MSVIKKNILRRIGESGIPNLFKTLKERQWGLVRSGETEQRSDTGLSHDSGEIIAKDDQGNIHVFPEERTINNRMGLPAYRGALFAADDTGKEKQEININYRESGNTSTLYSENEFHLESEKSCKVIINSDLDNSDGEHFTVYNKYIDDHTELLQAKASGSVSAPNMSKEMIANSSDDHILVTKEYVDEYAEIFKYSAEIPHSGHRVDINFSSMSYGTGFDITIALDNIANCRAVASYTFVVDGDGQGSWYNTLYDSSTSSEISEPQKTGNTVSFYVHGFSTSNLHVNVTALGSSPITSVVGEDADYTGTELKSDSSGGTLEWYAVPPPILPINEEKGYFDTHVRPRIGYSGNPNEDWELPGNYSVEYAEDANFIYLRGEIDINFTGTSKGNVNSANLPLYEHDPIIALGGWEIPGFSEIPPFVVPISETCYGDRTSLFINRVLSTTNVDNPKSEFYYRRLEINNFLIPQQLYKEMSLTANFESTTAVGYRKISLNGVTIPKF